MKRTTAADEVRSPRAPRYMAALVALLAVVSCDGSAQSVTSATAESATTEPVSTTESVTASTATEPVPDHSTTSGEADTTTSAATPTTQPGPPSTETSAQSTTTEGPPSSPVLAGFGKTGIRVGDTPLTVVVADTPALRAQGLTRVEVLPDDIDGMLFVFENASEVNFTMRRTLIPLDIWWFDEEGTLIDSTAMEPCTADPCTLYPSPGPIKWALETTQDEFELSAGDVLVIGG